MSQYAGPSYQSRLDFKKPLTEEVLTEILSEVEKNIRAAAILGMPVTIITTTDPQQLNKKECGIIEFPFAASAAFNQQG